MTTTRTRTFTWSDPAAFRAAAATQSGLEMLRAIGDGTLAPPPVMDLLEFEGEAFDRGMARFAMIPAEYMENPLGTVHGGIVATILDTAMGCAVHTTLDVGTTYTTLDFQVRFARGVTATSGRCVAEAHVTHQGGRTVIAEATLKDASGRLCASATTTCLVFPIPARG